MSNKYNNIDELLKESLKDYGKKPSSGVWQKITFRLWFLEKGIYFLIPVIITVFVLVYFLFNNSGNSIEPINLSSSEKIEITNPNTQEKRINRNAQNSLNEENADNPNFEQITEKENIAVKQPQKSIPEHRIKEQAKTSMNTNGTKETANETTSENVLQLRNENFAASSFQNQMNNQNIYPELSDLEKVETINLNTFLLTTNSTLYLQQIQLRSSVNLMTPEHKTNRKPQGYWSYGIHIVPEIIFTNNEEKDKKQSVSLDLTGIYNIKNVYLEFGAGFGLSNDKSKFNIDYSQYDSIGFYYAVTEFSINQQTGQPSYKTEVENVYDTVYYKQTENADNLFTYLRIPVYFGVNIYRDKRMSVSAKAGGIYSLLIKSRMASYSFTNDDATWINVVNESYTRAKSNFQLSLAIGSSFRVNNSLSINIEPAYNYYINQIYVNNLSTKLPWSLSLKAGVILKF